MSQVFDNSRFGPVLSFGELLIRFCPDAGGEWLGQSRLPFYIGGAELNVANALALWDIPVRYFTALPDNSLSRQIAGYVNSKGIDTSAILYAGNRIGLYFLTKGKDLKNDALVYDRAGSSFASLKTGMIDWDEVLNGVSWFHFSAICPAIGQNVADVCAEALEAASAKGVITSVDLNYRSKLWQYGKSPADVMPGLVEKCDVVMGNIWAVETMLGIQVMPDIHKISSRAIYLDEALRMSQRVMQRFSKCKAVANTFRFDATNEIKYYGALYANGRLYQSHEYKTGSVTDKVGSGDCFMAGLIYGFYNALTLQETLEYATAAAFSKLFIESDATTCTVADIKNTIK
jgi:2-dehydro-3-deoxygluconokinase